MLMSFENGIALLSLKAHPGSDSVLTDFKYLLKILSTLTSLVGLGFGGD